MAWARVQAPVGKSQDNSTSTMTISLGSNVTVGSLIVVPVHTYNGSTRTVAVSGAVNGSYTQAGSYATQGTLIRTSIWYFANSGAGTETITITPNAAVYMHACAVEYSGIATSSSLVATSTGGATSTTPATGSVTINQSGDLLVSAFGTESGPGSTSNGITCKSGQGFFYSGYPLGGSVAAFFADYLATATGTQQFGIINSVNWSAIGACFKLASYPGAGGGGNPIIGSSIVRAA